MMMMMIITTITTTITHSGVTDRTNISSKWRRYNVKEKSINHTANECPTIAENRFKKNDTEAKAQHWNLCKRYHITCSIKIIKWQSLWWASRRHGPHFLLIMLLAYRQLGVRLVDSLHEKGGSGRQYDKRTGSHMAKKRSDRITSPRSLRRQNCSINSFSAKPCLIFHTRKAPSPSGVATTWVRECWAFEWVYG